VLTQFVLNPKVLKHVHPIFKKILEEYNIISAFVSSMDEMFLSVSMDFHKSVTMQAFLHIDGKFEAAKPEFPRISMALVKEEDFAQIQRLSKNFFDFLNEPRKKDMYEIYMLKNEDTILGFGLLEYGEIVKDVRSLGIYTIEEYRQKGVGRSMMMHLKDMCYEQGVKPLTGCNWYNKRSNATLDSAGFIPKTRLFRVEFTEDEKWVSI
jgi:GNAT superfamily N-acetyltransferase